MAVLEDIKPNFQVKGILPSGPVTVLSAQWHGSDVVEVTYRDVSGKLGSELLFRDRQADLEMSAPGRPWAFDADPELFCLVSEAYRIRMAHLFDLWLAIHLSLVEPLPHQITAVYGEILPRQPLRFLLADDPGAGKTIMTGLFIKELLLRGDLQRCLIVSPGSLTEQWQDELWQKFQLPFELLTNDKIEAARTGNALNEMPLVIARLDKLSRDEDLQAKLQQTDWDLVVFDEAHKLSASIFGGEIKYTKRYRLGQLLTARTRHLLLLTATPHNGKEEDFQLFMGLLDPDRFEGKYREGVHNVDASDLMRRLVKEQLLKFDGKPLFPERRAYTVDYDLSELEAALYEAVTHYVTEEFNRADNLDSDRRNMVGFALTLLQRRLASSPEAIYQSLRRREERLESWLRETRLLKRGAAVYLSDLDKLTSLDEEALEDLEDAPEGEQVVESFFKAAFEHLGGTLHKRESKRYEITHVPAVIRNRSFNIGRGTLLSRYERVTFYKEKITLPGKPLAEFLCPGHPLMDAVNDLVLERYRGLLRQGAILVDENDPGEDPRLLVYLEESIQDGRAEASGHRRVIARQMQFVEMTPIPNPSPETGEGLMNVQNAGPAPFLDHKPLPDELRPLVQPLLEKDWLKVELEASARAYAVQHLAPRMFSDERQRREEMVSRTIAAVKDRLTKEISYWDNRAQDLKAQEQAGRVNARLNSEMAQRRADELQARLQRRMEELEQERQLSAQPPLVLGAALVVPAALLTMLQGRPLSISDLFARHRKAVEDAAMRAVMEKERRLGYLPMDVSKDNLGWDIESAVPGTGKLRFIEVKGRVEGAETVTVAKNEILAGLNKPEDYWLAVVEAHFEGEQAVAELPLYLGQCPSAASQTSQRRAQII